MPVAFESWTHTYSRGVEQRREEKSRRWCVTGPLLTKACWKITCLFAQRLYELWCITAPEDERMENSTESTFLT